jgi:hypothetical protein
MVGSFRNSSPQELLCRRIWNLHESLLKWLRYQRVISLKTQVGITNQRNKWAVSPVPWSWMRSYPLSNSVCQVRCNYWYEKCQTTYGLMKVCNYKLNHCNGHRTCKTLTSTRLWKLILHVFIQKIFKIFFKGTIGPVK